MNRRAQRVRRAASARSAPRARSAPCDSCTEDCESFFGSASIQRVRPSSGAGGVDRIVDAPVARALLRALATTRSTKETCLMTEPTKSPVPRRRFLKKAAAGAAAAGALAAPAVSRAQTTSLRFQSTWPSKDIFHEYAQDFAKKVNDMAGSRLKIEVLPAGAVVPAFQLLEGVAKGTLDGGHGVVAYHYGKQSALALWGSGPGYGMDPNMLLAWHYYGGGKALLEEIYKSINVDVVSFLYGPMPTQPFGWFKKPVARLEDMKGIKFRTVGLAVDLYTEQGAAVNPLPGSEIVPALDRGLIDAAEFNNASSDRVLGFPDVVKNCMLQ